MTSIRRPLLNKMQEWQVVKSDVLLNWLGNPLEQFCNMLDLYKSNYLASKKQEVQVHK